MTSALCGIESCPAAATGDDGLCTVHRTAKRAAHVKAGRRCAKCKRAIVTGDWITRESTMSHMTHAVCPPVKPAPGRKRDQHKPFLEGSGAN